MKLKIRTIKRFQSFLQTLHFGSCPDNIRPIVKRVYTEEGYDGEPNQDLYLYYLDGKHIGTFNRTAKTCFTVGIADSCPT